MVQSDYHFLSTSYMLYYYSYMAVSFYFMLTFSQRQHNIWSKLRWSSSPQP
jgi:hypothetical protein